MEKTESDYWISRWGNNKPIPLPDTLKGIVKEEPVVKKGVLDRIFAYMKYKPVKKKLYDNMGK